MNWHTIDWHTTEILVRMVICLIGLGFFCYGLWRWPVFRQIKVIYAFLAGVVLVSLSLVLSLLALQTQWNALEPYQELFMTLAFVCFLIFMVWAVIDANKTIAQKFELSQREKWLQSIYENLPIGVAALKDNSICYANSAFNLLQFRFSCENPFESIMENQLVECEEEVWLTDKAGGHFAFWVSCLKLEEQALSVLIVTEVTESKTQQRFIHTIASKMDTKNDNALNAVLDTLAGFLPDSFIYIGQYHSENKKLFYLSHRGDQSGLSTDLNYDVKHSPFNRPNQWVWLSKSEIDTYQKDLFISRFKPQKVGGVLLADGKGRELGLVVVMQKKAHIVAPLIMDFLSIFTHRVRAEFEQILYQRIIQRSEERYKAFITRSREAIVHIDLRPPINVDTDAEVQWLQFVKVAHITEYNPAFINMFDFEGNPDTQKLLEISSLKHILRYTLDSGYGSETVEVPHENKNGDLNWISCTSMGAVEDGRLIRIWLIIRDITESKTHIEHLQYQARHDVLTGLPNRTALRDTLEEKIEQANQFGFKVALLLIDLDRFKEINDTLGHHYGDVLLKKIGPRIKPLLVPSRSILGRLGGDEFAVIIPSLPNQQEALDLATSIMKKIREPFDLGQMNVEIAGSIGIAIFPQNGRDTSTLLRCADVAMYKAKHHAGGILLYSHNMDEHSPRRLAIMTELGQAVRENQLFLCFQPKVQLTDNKICSAEALIRWRHPEHGLMPPSEFIPLAEVTDLIIPITEWVIKNAVAQVKIWLQQGLNLKVAVNVSTRNLLDENLIGFIERSLQESGVPPEYLEIEITESALMVDPEHALETLNKINELGVSLAVDDFGTGYSSLAYLRRLPINALKIDLTFVRHMCKNPQDEIIVHSIVNLSHNLSLTVVAEGVEDQETMSRLRNMGCNTAQGFYISAPIVNEEFEAFYQRWNMEPMSAGGE